MNSKKYKDVLYEMRPISNLKELLTTSYEMFNTNDAFLVKDKPGGKYQPISYGQLYMDVNGLGTSFINMGLKDKKIAVIGENSYNWVVTYFATINGTGVIVPIDRELKTMEIKSLLKRAGVSAVVYSKKVKRVIDEILLDYEMREQIKYAICMNYEDEEEGRLYFDDLIEAGKQSMEEGNRVFIDSKIDDEALAALLFTSGTTGMAKGVMLSHKNIAANVYNMSKYVKIIDKGVGLSVLPMHHTYEMTCHVLTGLYQGVTIAICEGLKHIQKNLQEIPANVMLAVPLIFETMHKKVWKKAAASGRDKKMRKAADLSNKFKL